MKRTGKIYLAAIAFLLLCWIVPRLYFIITVKPSSTPFTMYSCIVKDFVSLEDRSGKDFVFVDTEGRAYADSVLPFFYYRLLSSRNDVPEHIAGHVFTGEQIELNNFFFTSSPEDVNKDRPDVHLLLESNPPRLELQDADYALVFRKDGLKVVEIAENRYAEALQTEFRSALDSVGFVFPADQVAGKPDTHKSYDEGYLVTDSRGELFHIKLRDGRPSVEKINRDGVEIAHLFITENANRRTLGYLFDPLGRMYILDSQRNIVPTDVLADVGKQELLIIGDILNYTVRVSDINGEDFWALDSDSFKTVGTFRRDYDEEDSFDLPKYILPFRLTFTSHLSPDITPRIVDFSWAGLAVDIVLAALVALFVFLYRRKLHFFTGERTQGQV